MDNHISSEQIQQNPPLSNFPSRKSNLPIIFAGITLLFLFAIGGILVGKNLIVSQNISPIPTLAPKSTMIPTLNLNETADWKMYTNTQFHYSLKYPSDFLLYTGNPPEGSSASGIQITNVYPDKPIKSNEEESDKGVLLINIAGEVTKTTPKWWTESIEKHSFGKTINVLKEFSFQGKPAIEVDEYNPGLLFGKQTVYWVFNDNKIFTIDLTLGVNAEAEIVKTFDQILSTLKFTDTTNTPQMSEYKTRYFNVSDMFFNNEKYPTELTSVLDSSLTPMACTSLYSGYGKDYTSYDEKTQESTPLTDSSLLSYIQILNKKYSGKTVNEILSCTTKQGIVIILYSLGPCGGGCSGIPYVGVVEGSDIREAGTMTENMAYFGCRQPLQLVDNTFYYKCGGGDGPGASASIYKLSLNTFSVSRIKQCEIGVDQAGKPYARCD